MATPVGTRGVSLGHTHPEVKSFRWSMPLKEGASIAFRDDLPHRSNPMWSVLDTFSTYKQSEWHTKMILKEAISLRVRRHIGDADGRKGH